MSANEYAQIGWIGLGQMGLPMVTRLLDGGIEVGVYNRSPDKTAPISAKGAKVYGNTAELVRDYPVIFLMVSDYAAVCDILNGVRDGLAGKIIVNMSTISPTENLAVKALVEAAGGQFAEAPVSGSVGPATNGTLLILFGGSEAVLNPLQKIFSLVGKKTFHFGDVGKRFGRETRLELALGHFRRSVQRSDADGAAVRHRYRHHRRSHRRLGNGLAHVPNQKIPVGKPRIPTRLRPQTRLQRPQPRRQRA
ncbi:3-hydroxyisobutyrate dehydrogenase [Neisseria meningitidis]|nr:3-hydroxyisobutyrate dehydrogenase [Neisseria meningitidis]